jgi:PAS domain S-box-containing protein
VPDRLPVARVQPAWLRYGAALAGVAVAAWATWQLPPVAGSAPFALFFAVVAVVAVYGGWGPATLAIALSALVSSWAFLPPVGSFGLEPDSLLRIGFFVGVGSLIIALAELRLRRERRERAQREWCEVTLASVGDGVIVTDAEGRVLTMNRVAEALTGWSASEARMRPLHEVFAVVDERTRAPMEDPVVRVRREAKPVGLANHAVLLRRDGGELPVDDSGAPIWSEDGRVVGVVLVFRDISERKEAECRRTALLESERRAKLEAEAANRAKDAFLAVLSHELRTPLNAIVGWTQLLRLGPVDPAELARGMEVIERNAQRQTRLIEDVLDVSRIVSGKLRLELEPVDLGRVVEAAVEVVRPSLEAKDLRLEITGDCGGLVLGDAHRLQQVVWNLLSNAAKFTPAGGRIEVSMRRMDHVCELSVRDTGRGIRPEFLPHVFDRFRQEQETSTRLYGGLGLGLAIVRHLVEMHGGSVDASSEGVDKGATFSVRLPRVAAATPRARAPEPPVPKLGPAGLAGLRVLAVDDEADARELVATLLRRAGAEVRVAGSTDEALQILDAWTPDVLVSDLEMPGEDGYELLRRIRVGAHADLPAIALTAYAAAQERIRALEAGFALHLPKPVDAAELQLVVLRATRGRPARSAKTW